MVLKKKNKKISPTEIPSLGFRETVEYVPTEA